MSRRYAYPPYGKQFCRNTKKMEVHDLDREDASSSGCQINEIIRSRHAKAFMPDTLAQAYSEGFDNCAKCIGGSRR